MAVDQGQVKQLLKENGLKVKLARQRLQTVQAKEPTLQEIAQESGLSVEDVVLAMDASIPAGAPL